MKLETNKCQIYGTISQENFRSMTELREDWDDYFVWLSIELTMKIDLPIQKETTCLQSPLRFVLFLLSSSSKELGSKTS